MLDIRFIRENAELVANKAQQKGYKTDVSRLLQADEKRRDLLKQLEDIRAQRNALTEKSKGAKPSEEQIAQGKDLRQKAEELEAQLEPAESGYRELLAAIPNVFPDDTPLGGEEANREEKKWGDTAGKGFEVQDHLAWAEKNGLIDFERGAKVAGNKFYYLKAGLVEMELALAQFSLALVKKHGFWPMMVPHMVNTRILEGAGFSAKGDEKQIYKIEGEDLNLIATAEIPLTGFFADEIIPSEWLPSRMAGISPSYRVEAGAYGKHSRGLYRVHQFNKTELYIYCRPEESEEQHQKLLAIEEEICQKLELPYRVVRIAAGDLGAPAYKKYDVEYWSPADKSYHELMSCSNVTDYQARRLNIRYKNDKGETKFVHTLNATAAAYSRMLIAIIENNQTEGGKVSIPMALRTYMGGELAIG
ncbi:MAG TPA: serine--tRNA ligase [Candidatus Saccharimonadales bacterium]|nr:serine--tRNA ligase [Candidatus Saccharimonadales bacterium]